MKKIISLSLCLALLSGLSCTKYEAMEDTNGVLSLNDASGPSFVPNATTTYTMKYDFESSTLGFTAIGNSAGPWSVTDWKSTGSKSLKVDAVLSSNKQIFVQREANDSFSGKSHVKVVVRHATWGNHGSGMTAKLFLKTGTSWQWFDGGAVAINSNTTGITLTINLSSVANLPSIKAIGVQFVAAANASGNTSLYIDAIQLGTTADSPPDVIALTPVTPGYNAHTNSILNKLGNLPSQSVNRTVSGQFIGYSGFAFSTQLIGTIYTQTNNYTGIIGMDIANGGDGSRNFLDVFNYSNNSNLVSHWNSGGLIAISHHFPNPLRQTGKAGMSSAGRETTANIDNMLYGPSTNNPDRQRWFDGLWKVYLGLLDMRSRGITVIYRPLHEMNGDWFWYGGLGTSTRPNSTSADFHKLWNSIFTYMTTAKGAGYPALDNLIWVYSPDYSRDKVTDYYVSGKVDIVALDAYLDDPHTNSTLSTRYNQLLGLGKPFAFAEIGPKNTRTDGQFNYSNWLEAIKNRFGKTTFFMAWNDFGNVKIAPTSNLNASSLYNNYNWMFNRGEAALR